MLCTGTGRVVVRIVRVSLVHVKESHLFAAVSKPSKVQVCKGKEVAPQLCAAYVQRMCSVCAAKGCACLKKGRLLCCEEENNVCSKSEHAFKLCQAWMIQLMTRLLLQP